MRQDAPRIANISQDSAKIGKIWPDLASSVSFGEVGQNWRHSRILDNIWQDTSRSDNLRLGLARFGWIGRVPAGFCKIRRDSERWGEIRQGSAISGQIWRDMSGFDRALQLAEFGKIRQYLTRFGEIGNI